MAQGDVTLGDGAAMSASERYDAMALQLSEVAYLHTAGAEMVATAAGWESVDTIERRGVQAVLAVHEDTAFIAFRGTSEDVDLAYDLLFAPPLNRPMCHPGFLLAWNAVRAEVRAWLGAQQPRYERVVLTGHSLGGAIAAVAAVDFASDFHVARVVTFGMPRTFWLRGARNYDRAVVTSTGQSLGEITGRYVNADDLIPRVVPWLLGYVHVGTLVPCGGDPLHGLQSGLAVLEAVMSPGSQSGASTDGTPDSWRTPWRAGLGLVAAAIALTMPALMGALIAILVLRAVALSAGSHGLRRYLAALDVRPMPRNDRSASITWNTQELVTKDVSYPFATVAALALLAVGTWQLSARWGWLTVFSGALTNGIAIAIGAVIVTLLLRVDQVNSPRELFGFAAPKARRPFGIAPGAGASTEEIAAAVAADRVTSVPSDAQRILDGSSGGLGAREINPLTGKPWGFVAALLVAAEAISDEEE